MAAFDHTSWRCLQVNETVEAQPDEHSLLYLPYPTGVPGDRFRWVLPVPQAATCTARCMGAAASGRFALACLPPPACTTCPYAPVLDV